MGTEPHVGRSRLVAMASARARVGKVPFAVLHVHLGGVMGGAVRGAQHHLRHPGLARHVLLGVRGVGGLPREVAPRVVRVLLDGHVRSGLVHAAPHSDAGGLVHAGGRHVITRLEAILRGRRIVGVRAARELPHRGIILPFP
eukprot:9497658-Pyramimonas_sp.AAC.2